MATPKKNLNHQILAQFSGNQAILSIPKIYYRITKCLNKAYLLNQIVFYSDKSTYCKDGWFYKTYEEWQEELLVSDRTLRTYFKEFERDNFIDMKISKVGGVRTPFFRPKMDNITAAIVLLLEKEAPTEQPNENQTAQQDTQTEESSELNKDCPKRKKLPNSQTEKFSVSNTIYTDENDQIKTTTDQTPSSSPFFSKKQTVDLTALKLTTDPRSEKLFLEHCQHHIENQKNDLTTYQRIAGLKTILKGVQETGEYFKAKGFIDLDAEKERVEQEKERERQFREAQDRQHEERLASYKKSSEKAKESKPSQERRGVPTSIKSLLGMNHANA